jgi:hypothetical protein
MATKILKLISGEELIADVAVGREEVTVQKPFHLSMARDPEKPDGDLQLALFPYSPYIVDHTLHINKNNIIWMEEAHDSMIKDYARAIASLKITDVKPK